MGRCLKPSEESEQIAFVQWCKLNNIVVHHSPNEGGGGKQAAIRGARMKRMGTSKGFWDLTVFIPIKGITGEIDCYEQIMIEMKATKGGTVSKEQKAWQEIYEMAGIPCKVCKGADEAIEFVQLHML